MEENNRQVGHDVATFLPYPDSESEFNLIISIKFYELPLLSDSILAISIVKGVYNTEIDKSELLSKEFSSKLILKRDGLDYTKYFEQNYNNQEVINKILKELGSVFNEHINEVMPLIMECVERLMEE